VPLKRYNDTYWVLEQDEKLVIRPDITAHYHLPTLWFRLIILDNAKSCVGSGIIKLEKYSESESHNFTCPLSEKGTAWGKIEGTIAITRGELLVTKLSSPKLSPPTRSILGISEDDPSLVSSTPELKKKDQLR